MSTKTRLNSSRNNYKSNLETKISRSHDTTFEIASVFLVDRSFITEDKYCIVITSLLSAIAGMDFSL